MKKHQHSRSRVTHLAAVLCLTFAALANSTPALAAAPVDTAAMTTAELSSGNGLDEPATLVIFGAVLAIGAAVARRTQSQRTDGAVATPSHPPALQTQSATPLAR